MSTAACDKKSLATLVGGRVGDTVLPASVALALAPGLAGSPPWGSPTAGLGAPGGLFPLTTSVFRYGCTLPVKTKVGFGSQK